MKDGLVNSILIPRGISRICTVLFFQNATEKKRVQS